MIKSWKHKGLQRFVETGSAADINPLHVKRLRGRLRFIDLAETIEDVNVAGYKLHSLQGDREGIWSVTVSGNWRITFEFKDGDAFILNYEDYH
ncbi:type II toxin-antitoxin system RelE/ParE family toxin [Yersinia intermedia]|jgi:proteic killer suppression protein|uniref:Killer protein n=1 Tax=Yersinia intermedia TaxID=631 RepID=A0A209A0B4_YERIN|nr:type II toxin-antitoxin system RelE/ParE family toxin [Yersinia intermedia]MCB5314741.1 type II toxin-antitoxin system RelE/ParE family toxin [Yersinia intermedia]MCB5322623.1 type II toxin-antitoxin system RelE/ParE family toxin [Yersinia intermedia]MCB5328553.1 type II toxin-antitoxin system RelE/ParE family toxin [Yersinia intermedia]OVZ86139.1 Killer protein [Yersinia intermedia]WET15797.1 type II toxin-antitoxin system RelE/ParE family toxin [Yersinia intermedia]